MPDIGKILIIAGGVLVVVGLAFVFGDRIPWIGRLPGDISIAKGRFRFYFPVTTCLIVSIILTILVSIFRK